jgi:hypothetical protein
MSWRYRRSRNYSRSYQPKFFFSEKQIDFTSEHLDYSQFLLQEFFTADLETRKKISKYYNEVYGSLSFAYLKRKYSDWANGDYHLTDMMKERIISIMPKFLNEKSKHKLGIHEFMASIKNTIKSFESSQKRTFRNTTNLKLPEEVVAIFEKEYERIQALTIQKFRYNVLTEDEKIEALEISKYILEIKLQNIFNQIERDFKIFLPYMLNFKRGVFSSSYRVSLFNLNLDITKASIENLEIPEFKIIEVESNSRFREYSDKYLAYELVSIHKEVNRAVSNSYLNANDISLFFTHYEELSNGENEVSISCTFQGEGGVLSLKVQIKPLKLLKRSAMISLIKLSIYLILISALFSLALNYKLINLLIFGTFFIGIFGLNLISEEIKQIKSLTKQIKTYGQ